MPRPRVLFGEEAAVSDIDPVIKNLREAVRLTPKNVPLRRHLAAMLAERGLYEEAAKEFRAAMTLEPDNADIKLDLAKSYCSQGKLGVALEIVEELLKLPSTPPAAYVLHARILLNTDDVERAVRQYKTAIDLDPEIADSTLESELGIQRAGDSGEGYVVDGRVRSTADEDPEMPDFQLERPQINFRDVGGMDSVKEEIRMKILFPLQQPELYKAYGKSIGGGILMYGPPGCGKTHLARATAGEVKARFLSIGIHDVLEMWVGQSERNLHQIFETARRHQPCVLFFDEVDALGASRADLRHSPGRQNVNQFLSELDGVNTSNEGVLVLAATNAPWHLDSAFRRPGRFDRIIFVPPPDTPARADIVRVLLKGKPVKDLDADAVARKTEGFSGADLKAVVDRAIESKLREAMSRGVPAPILTADLLHAAKTTPPTTKEWFATARNYALYSNEGGLYDDILKFLKLT